MGSIHRDLVARNEINVRLVESAFRILEGTLYLYCLLCIVI